MLLHEHAKCKRQASVKNCTKSARWRFLTQDASYLERHLTTRPHETVEQVIQRECGVRFSLAHSAPIMTTLLGELLCYLLDETLARSIITGMYNLPSDMDPDTKLILEEIGILGMKIVNDEGSKIVITPEDFKRFWRKVKEFTSSLMLGVHYGHYKATIQDVLSTEILAQQSTVIARSGIPPENWSIGLQVMLEKIAGVCLVGKL